MNSLTNPLLNEINSDKLVIIDNFLFISNSLKSLKIVIENYLTESNASHKIFLSYELFGRKIL